MGYFVHVPGKGEPTVEHVDYNEAVKEAERLALKNKKDVRIYEVRSIVRIEYRTQVQTVINRPNISADFINGICYEVGDRVLCENMDGYHIIGTIVSIGPDGLYEIKDTTSTIQVVYANKILNKINPGEAYVCNSETHR